MARIFQEGFEIRRHAGHYAEFYSTAPSVAGTAAGRLHGFSYDFTNGVGTTFVTETLPAHQKYTAGIGAQINSPDDSPSQILLGFLDSGTIQMAAYVVSEGGSSDDYHIEIYRGVKGGGGTLLDSSDIILGGDGYHYFEFQAIIANSGGSWEMRQNGTVICIGTGDTQNTANATVNQFQYQGATTSAVAGSSRWNIDDIYLNDGSGSLNNDFSGDTVLEGLLPSAAGVQTDWDSESNGSPSGTANWDQVNDSATATPDNDTGYVASQTVGEVDLYAWQDLQFITGQIQALMFVARTRIEATGARVLGLRYRDVSTSQADLDDTANVTNATYDEKVFITELNPTTASLFSVAQINGMQVGPKVVS